MTNEAATEIRQWLVSARTRGELLATSARGPGIELVMLGVPAGYSSEEVESWLGDLMGMSIETSGAEAGDRPIPALLHHLLTGLIFSHAELWDRAGTGAPSSMAFVRTPGAVAFGWVDGPPPDLWIDDHPAQVEWVRIRDHDGREAFALSIDPVHRVRVHFGIAPPAGASSGGASVDAAWVPDVVPGGSPGAAHGHPEADAVSAREGGGARSSSAVSRAVGARASTPSEPLPMSPIFSQGDRSETLASFLPQSNAGAEGGEGWRVVYEAGSDSGPAPPALPARGGNWWMNVVKWVSRGGGKDEEKPDFEPAAGNPRELPDRIPPTPEPVELTARTAPAPEFEPVESMTEIQLAPLLPEEPAPDRVHDARPASAPGLLIESVHLEAPAAAASQPAAHSVPPAPHEAPRPVDSDGSTEQVDEAPAAPHEAAPVRAPLPAPISRSDAPAFLEPFAAEDAVTVPPGSDGRVAMRPRWADAPPPRRTFVAPGKPWVWAVGVLALFLAGWFVGGTQGDRPAGEPGTLSRTLRALGLGGVRFDVPITSRPPGAWIAVDGKDLARRTPAVVDLSAGTHQVSLSFSDLGAATFEVRGLRGDRVPLDANLWGSLAVYGGDGGIPVAVTVDGVSRGLAPVTVDSLMPGTHEIRFSGPGLQPWGQTVQVRVQESAQVVARAVTSPATGVLEIRAVWTDAEGSVDLPGARVFVDGEKRGVTPMTLDLPRGPHSVRVESRGEESPVQVIDLPGGNQRFANFELGLGIDRPHLTVLGTPVRVPLELPSVLSAALQGMSAGEAREMWLHVRQPDGAWRRYPMAMMKAPGGIVGTVVFPNTMLDSQGRTPFYVSASNQTGDDFFSELLIAAEQPGSSKK